MNRLQEINIPGIAYSTGNRRLTFAKMVNDQKMSYYDSGRIRLNGIKGTYYKLENMPEPLHQIAYLVTYSNVAFMITSPQYAPEIRKCMIFIGDTRLRKPESK